LVFVAFHSYQYLQYSDSWEEQQIPIYYLTVNIDSWEEQQIPIDYLTVNSHSWEEQRILIDYLTVNIDDNLLVFVALPSYQYLQ
jgi:hypothetical protein